jgi:hypothetical protein
MPAALATTSAGAAAMKWLRRIHLYSAIAMPPFVVVHGLSALLFHLTEPDVGLDAARLLQRMHQTHGYGSDLVRTLWSVVVDVLGLCMLFWALSGLVMGWQRRPHRVTGGVVLVAALAAAGGLAVGLHLLASR